MKSELNLSLTLKLCLRVVSYLSRMVHLNQFSFEVAVNPAVLSYFKEMRVLFEFENIDGHIVPRKREFIYLIRDYPNYIHGNIKLFHSKYKFDFDDSDRKFWLESTTYLPEAFVNKDTNYWQNERPIKLNDREMEFIRVQDSIETSSRQ